MSQLRPSLQVDFMEGRGRRDEKRSLSLLTKNILSFLASGTRAKLNKSEMYKIEINISKDKTEQTAIATILSDMDTEIESLEQKRYKYILLKQGMMQELLTGKTRLVETKESGE